MPWLEQIWMADDGFTGPIPDYLFRMPNLVRLAIHNNALTGSLPANALGESQSLMYMNIQNNQLSGSIPETLSRMTNLVEFTAMANDLTGPLPASIGSMTNLRHLSIQNNKLSGTIPADIGNVPLGVFEISNNYFSGTLPSFVYRISAKSLANNCFLNAGDIDPSQASDICAPYLQPIQGPEIQPPTDTPSSTIQPTDTSIPSSSNPTTRSPTLTSGGLPSVSGASTSGAATASLNGGGLPASTLTDPNGVRGAQSMDSGASMPGWVIALIVTLVIGGACVVFVGVMLVWRRNLRRRRTGGLVKSMVGREVGVGMVKTPGISGAFDNGSLSTGQLVQTSHPVSSPQIFPEGSFKSVAPSTDQQTAQTSHPQIFPEESEKKSGPLFSAPFVARVETLQTRKRGENGFPHVVVVDEKSLEPTSNGSSSDLGPSGNHARAVMDWDVGMVSEWLTEAEVGRRVVRILRENNVTGSVLLSLTDASLFSMQILNPNARQMLLSLIDGLRFSGDGSLNSGQSNEAAFEESSASCDEGDLSMVSVTEIVSDEVRLLTCDCEDWGGWVMMLSESLS
ncbi:hypothetical protein HDU67_005122, partial [Dinochytrium kinnereticum]